MAKHLPQTAPIDEQAAPVRREEAIRLELLRLVWRPDRDAETAIEAAKKLEAYVVGKEQD